MKKVFFGAVVLAALATGSTAAAAQGGGGAGRGMGGARMMEMMFKDITLSDAQKVQRDSIVAKFAPMMPVFTPGSPPSAEDRQKRTDVMGKQNAEIRAILTDDQKTVFDKNMTEMQNMRRPGQD